MREKHMVYKYRNFASIILLFFLVNCSSGAKYHPDEKFLPDEESISFKKDLNDISESDLNLSTSALSLRSTISDTSTTNDYNNLLLHVSKFDIDPSGYVYIPQMYSTINVYDENGSYLYSIGRGGRGPGEFLRLLAFDFSEDFEKLYVLGGLKVEVFTLAGKRYEHERSFIHNLLNAKSICTMKDKLYISGFSFTESGFKNDSESDRIASLPIHQFQNEEPFNLIRSFGFEYRSHIDMPQFNRFMTATELACNAATETIIGQMVSFPYMFGYTMDGTIKWISKFENFLPTIYKEDSRPSVIPDNQEMYHRVYPFREIYNSEFELLQIGYHYPFWYGYAQSHGEHPEISNPEGSTYKTLLIDSETGYLKSLNAEFMIGAIRNETILRIDVVDSVNHVNRIAIYDLQK